MSAYSPEGVVVGGSVGITVASGELGTFRVLASNGCTSHKPLLNFTSSRAMSLL